MISTTALELRAGARLLVSGVNVRINHGDRIGFVLANQLLQKFLLVKLFLQAVRYNAPARSVISPKIRALVKIREL
jgi:flagellar biosynthesis regulator FlbT